MEADKPGKAKSAGGGSSVGTHRDQKLVCDVFTERRGLCGGFQAGSLYLGYGRSREVGEVEGGIGLTTILL